MSRSAKNAALGSKMARELRGCTTAISNPAVQNFVESLGRKLAAQLPKSDLTFTVNVIEEDLSPQIHEPIALPGGYIFVPAALFMAAQDGAEFAGMLAQAMAQSNAMEEDLSRMGAHSYVMSDSMETFLCTRPVAIPTSYLGEQRAIESRADLTAVSLLARAGFDPNALVRYVQRVQAAAGAVRSSFSALPPVRKRIAGMSAEIAKLPPEDFANPEMWKGVHSQEPASAFRIPDGSEFAEATAEVGRHLAASPRSDGPSLKRK